MAVSWKRWAQASGDRQKLAARLMRIRCGGEQTRDGVAPTVRIGLGRADDLSRRVLVEEVARMEHDPAPDAMQVQLPINRHRTADLCEVEQLV